MKLLIVHDEYGNIRSAGIADSKSDCCTGLRVQRGELVTELEEQESDLAEFRRDPKGFCERFRLDPINRRLVGKKQ